MGSGTELASGAPRGHGGTGRFQDQVQEASQAGRGRARRPAGWPQCGDIDVHFCHPLVQQKCDSATSDNEITHVFRCSQRASGARSCPHHHDADRVTCSWEGGRLPGVLIHVSGTDSSDPTTFPSACQPPFTVSQGDRDLCRKSSCRFKEGPWGAGSPGSPGLSCRSFAVLAVPLSQPTCR